MPGIVDPTNITGTVGSCVHSRWFDSAKIPGVGFIAIVNCFGVPEQVLETGVTVINAEIPVLKLFKAVNELIFPTPVAANPMALLLFVH